MQARKKVFAGLIAAFAVVVSTVAPLVTAQASNSAPKGDLILVRNQDFATFDPSFPQNDSIFIQQQVYEPLFMIRQDGRSVGPWLAKSAAVASDKVTWTIKLRTDIKFSNGQTMNSADVKFSLDKATNAKGGWEFLNTAIDAITTPADDTVVIKTKFPWAPLLSDLACFSNAIVPNNYAGKTADAFFKNPIGTGPFTLDHWTPGTEVKLVANKTYWQPGKPYLNSVTWKYVADDNTRELMLKGGQADINESPPATAVAEMKSAGLKVGLFPAAQSAYLGINHKVPALSDVHVRRAISYAIDRKAIIKVVLAGVGFASNSIMAPNVGFYDPTTPGLQYNMKAAAAELAKSKYKKGLKLEYLATGGSSQDNAISSILQASLKKLGVKLVIKSVDPKVKRAMQKAMTYQLTSTAWTMDISDPDELLTFALNAKEGGAFDFYTNYDNPAVKAAVKKGQVNVDPKVRQAAYSFVQKKTADDAMMGYLFNAPYIYAWRTNITGFQVTPTFSYHMEDVKKS
jgi:peptide/nickel transport system substrate-binding protein